jgi:NDP-4-keto-2,6-dideoxyhexose 3-C-methyltransferase
MVKYEIIKRCRLCKSKYMSDLFSLGDMHLTGIFPKNKLQATPCGPVDLVKCDDCSLVQLKQTYSREEMYGDNYGYRSSLNSSMVNHLKNNIFQIKEFVDLNDNDIVLDIGSNDGTSLNFLTNQNLQLIGMDPSADIFREYYHQDIRLIIDFFSETNFLKLYKNQKAKLITSFSMFYDLDDPLKFAQDIFNILDDEGVWFMEQSYLPLMLKANSFDTICQEHLTYYSFKQIEWIAKKIGFIILDVKVNEVNGGSFQVVLSKAGLKNKANENNINNFKIKEESFFSNDVFVTFRENIEKSKNDLMNLLVAYKKENKKVYGLGASTKGNVLIQYFNLDDSLLPFIGEVNPKKFGAFTPGSLIPIISEEEILKKNPDALVVFPWHFRDFFRNNNKFKDIELIFPLPQLERYTF